MVLAELDAATRAIGKLEMTTVRTTNSKENRNCFTELKKPGLPGNNNSGATAPSPKHLAVDL
jgi:hypothetical protein